MAHQLRSSLPQSPDPSFVGHDGEYEMDSYSHQSGLRLRGDTSHARAESQVALLPQGGGHEQHSHHQTLKQQSNSRNLVEAPRKMGRQGLFLGLTILTTVMVIINFVQTATLHRLPESNWRMWIVYFPLIVFILGLGIIGVLVFLSRKTLWSEWKEGEDSQRVAWFGIVLSILLTTIFCQFAYMPQVAVPKYFTTQWTTSMDLSDNVTFPAMIVAWTNGYDNFNLSNPSCTYQHNPGRKECNTSDIIDISNATLATFGQYIIVNPWEQPYSMINTGFDGANSYYALALDAMYNGSNPNSTLPQFYVGLYDPGVKVDLHDFLYICGNPPVYYCMLPQVKADINVQFHAETHQLDDKIYALRQQRLANPAGDPGGKYCSDEVQNLNEYKYYTGRFDSFPGDDMFASRCDLGDPNNKDPQPCSIYLQVSMASSIVNVQKSSHGTNMLDILTVEGSIIGGIGSLVWFFGIFAV